LRRFSDWVLIGQVYQVGVLTLVIIVVAAFLIGMVLALQGYYTLVDFGAESSLGSPENLDPC